MLGSRAALLAIFFLVSLAGCVKESGQRPVYSVEGKATYKGEPMAGARITFHPVGDSDPRALRPVGTVTKDGFYQLTTHLKADGSPAGDYVVTIYWPGRRASTTAGDEDEFPPDRLNRVYADPKTTTLRATVREQPNTIDFNLP